MAQKYAVVFHPETPLQLLQLLRKHVGQAGEFRYMYADEVDQGGYFIRLRVYSLDKDGKRVKPPEPPITLEIPPQYIMVVAHADAGDALPFGFGPKM